MALAIVHNKVATLPDEAGAEINKNEWNDAHGVSGTVDVSDITGLGTLATQNGTFSGTSSGTNTGDQTNISGNAATVTTNANLTGPVTSVGNATTLAVVTASGAYTPTITIVANLDVTGTTAYECQYLRVGSVVNVSGRVDVNPTLAATSTQLGISLPIASAIGAAEDCAGSAFSASIAGMGAAILGDATNDRAQLQFVSSDVNSNSMYFSFLYAVI